MYVFPIQLNEENCAHCSVIFGPHNCRQELLASNFLISLLWQNHRPPNMNTLLDFEEEILISHFSNSSKKSGNEHKLRNKLFAELTLTSSKELEKRISDNKQNIIKSQLFHFFWKIVDFSCRISYLNQHKLQW